MQSDPPERNAAPRPALNGRRRLILGAVGLAASACKNESISAQVATGASLPGDSAAAGPTQVADAKSLPIPSVVGARYKPTFTEDFSNDDMRRFSEAGTFSVDGAPAWRSRYRHPRKDIINKEKQIYVDRFYAGTGDKPLGINPFTLRDGIFSIIAERTRPEHRPFLYNMGYTSGCITTELSFAQQYGFFEMRAKFPVGRGFWPTFWLMPVRKAWPPEIDVVEASGDRPTKAHFAVRNPGDKKGYASDWMEVGPIDQWRTYQCEWTKDVIAFFIDGKKYYERRGHKIHEPMYLLANMALGSHDPYWIKDPDATTPLPARMQIDFIRAYSRA